ncbi:DUF4097 domain-containing protein [Nocardia cyriacigeorgica]|uniref:DUF4097 domain-containing protein n=1 Tax=Nocardia cyriacigeorgica TaxID=135487 RepID=A0A6P1D1Z9_9NOCA|nr:DUF4097 family beta strand repeat-containing protein [Nocardia cyriacigeorgica]NEW38487.1 DUF4097 domain-containing protein [Nocardia cyriacigeorgica]NEW43549.1 DUF4097 domain-containing protein [Nocardia cyriacigeorgica]NEW49515.1 DUF4097 domain-containing protein [Nocardia cyriacigeorgica]
MPTFQTPDAITVTIDVPSADVRVIASDRTDTVVEVRPADATKKNDVRAAEQTQIDYAAGNLTVHTVKGRREYTPFGGNASIEVTIEVPTGSQLKATAALGRLVGSGELGQCDLEIAAGDIIVERPLESVTAKTAKGDIRIGEASRGELRLETSMGELEVGIRPGSAARLETDAKYGSVQNALEPVDGAKGTVHVYARNSYGNIIIGHAA